MLTLIIISIILLILLCIMIYFYFQLNNLKDLLINKSNDINDNKFNINDINSKINNQTTIKKLIVDDLIINNNLEVKNKLNTPYIDTQTIHCSKFNDNNENKALNITSPVLFKKTVAITDKNINLYDISNKQPELFTEKAIIKNCLNINKINSKEIESKKIIGDKFITKYENELSLL